MNRENKYLLSLVGILDRIMMFDDFSSPRNGYSQFFSNIVFVLVANFHEVYQSFGIPTMFVFLTLHICRQKL